MADAVWMDVLPALDKFGPTLSTESNKAATSAGKTAGAAWGNAFDRAATNPGTAALVAELEKASAKSKKAVTDATRAIATARATERDATAKVTLAEQALADARTKHGTGSAQALAAEQKLEAARSRQQAAALRVESAEDSLKAAHREHKEVTQQLEKATKELGDQAGKQPGKWSKFKAALENTSNAGEKVNTSFTKMAALGSAIGNLAANAITRLTSAVGGFVSEAVSASDATDKFRTTLNFAGLDTRAIDTVTASARAYADATVYDLADIQNTTAQLAANGIADFTKLTEAAGNLNAVAGGNADTFKSVGMVLTQTAGQGKLTTENWNQLADAIPGASGKLQEALARNEAFTGNFRDAMSKGEITADEFNQALLQLGSDPIAVEAATSATTFEGALGNLKATILGGLTDALDALKGPMTSAIGWASDLAQGIGGVVSILVAGDFKGAAATFGWDEDSWQVDLLFNVRDTLIDIKDRAVEAFKTASEWVTGTAIPALSSLWDWLVRNEDWLKSVGVAVLGVAAAWKAMQVIGTVTKALTAFKTAQEAATLAQAAFNWVMSANPIMLVVTAVAALVAGLTYFFTQTETGKRAWAAFTGFLTSAWETVTGALKAGWDWLVGNVFEPIGTWLDRVGQWFSDVWTGIGDAVDGVVSWFGQSVLPVFEAVWGGIQTAASVAWDVLRVIFVTIATAFSLLWDRAKSVWAAVGQPIFDAVTAVATAAWTWLNENVFQPIAAGWQALLDGMAWVKDNVLVPMWQAVQDAAAAVWGFLRDQVFEPIKAAWQAVGDAFAWVKDNVLAPVWEALKAVPKAAWDFIKAHVFDPLTAAWRAVGDGFRWVKDNIIDPAWTGVRNLLKTGWDWIGEHVFDPMKRGVEAIGTVFQTVKDVISTAWDKVKEAAARPINFVIETVYTNGIKKTWDRIADAVGLDLKLPTVDPIKFATGGVLPGYTPGRDVHRFYSPTAGTLELSGGEAIMRPEWTRMVGGPAAVAAMNARARAGYAFADGGVWGWVGDAWDGIKGAASAAWDWTKNTAASAARFLADPIGSLGELIRKPVDALLARIGGGQIGQIVKEVPVAAVRALIDTVKGLVDRKKEQTAAAAGPTGVGPVMGIPAMTAALRALDPSARITSALRPGAITATGYPSYHGKGRAIDIVSPNMGATFDLIRAAYPTATELLYTPRGMLSHGRPFNAAPITRQMHYNHVHWAMANGGVLPTPPLLFDEGGWLPPGPSVVVNNTGKPEPLARVDAEGMRALGGGDHIEIKVSIDGRGRDDAELAEAVARRVGHELRGQRRGGRYGA